MFNNNDLPNVNAQVAISHEALALLRWLIEHHAEELKVIIKKALQTGLYKVLPYDSEQPLMPNEDSYESIIDFFNLLEVLFMESADEHAAQKAQENKLQPTIDQIDSTLCDTITVQSSIEKTANTLKDNPGSTARDILFKELLKHWTPHKQQPLN